MLSRGWVLSITKCIITPLPRPVNRITDACENITLPKTSFASGKKMALQNVLLLSQGIYQSSFPVIHKIDNVGILVLFQLSKFDGYHYQLS